jgi:hypothetical protein
VLLVTTSVFGRRGQAARRRVAAYHGSAVARFDAALLAILGVAVVALPTLLMASDRASDNGSATLQTQPPTPTNAVPPPTPEPRRTVPPSTNHHPSNDSGTVLLIIALVVIGLAVIAALVAIYRHWPSLRLGRRAAPVISGTALTDDEALAVAVDAGRDALLDESDPRAAVIACYLAMEESLRSAGVPRLPSDSPEELLERASEAALIGSTAAASLTTLFLEARFSTHPFSEAHRQRAMAALADIRHDLELTAQRAHDTWVEATVGDRAGNTADNTADNGAAR